MAGSWVEVDSVSARQVGVKKYVVTLSTQERQKLEALFRPGTHPARKLLRARILLKADASEAGEALTDSEIAAGLHTSLMTVARVRQQLVEEGVGGVFKWQPQWQLQSVRSRSLASVGVRMTWSFEADWWRRREHLARVCGIWRSDMGSASA